MRVIVIGAGGFVGSVLLGRLAALGHDVVAVDRRFDRNPSAAACVEGDVLDPTVLRTAFAEGGEAVVYLATIPGGAAEAAPDEAWRVNVEGVRAVADAAGAAGTCPRFVFASSIAVLGDALPSPGVDDGTPAAPTLLYGGHKRIAEEWLALLHRRGTIDAVSLRLPGIVARPAGGAGMRSAFMSDVFHAVAAGRRFVSPVSPDASLWVMSAACVAANLVHAVERPAAAMPASRAVTLPALHLSMATLVERIAVEAGTAGDRVHYDPDPALQAQFGSYPPLSTPAARRLGFVDDGDPATLVRTVLSQRNDA